MPARFRFPRFSVPLVLLVPALTLLAPAASAQTWSESPDAGNQIASAQTTLGTGPLTTITGTLVLVADEDLYCITITDPASFQASILCSVTSAPDLVLFDSTGVGVSQNDGCAGGGTTVTNAFVTTPGTHYLGVIAERVAALSGADSIWVEPPPALVERAPDGAGAAGALTGWNVAGASLTDPNYTIQLSGTGFCGLPAVPARPTSWGVLKARYRD